MHIDSPAYPRFNSDEAQTGGRHAPKLNRGSEKHLRFKSREQNMPNPIFANSVVRVGNGRGFITKSPYRERVVITAAHCLPEFMAAHPARHEHERTYRKLLGPLGAKPTIAVACAFVDPVADIAILKAVDYELWPQEQEAFAALTDVVRPLKIGKLPFTIGAKTKVWCLSLA